MKNLTEIVRYFSKLVDNGRDQRSIAKHMRSEVDELDAEIEKVENGQVEGSDGIIGENIDIIACALDSIFTHNPNITEEELNALMIAKCKKWVRVYG